MTSNHPLPTARLRVLQTSDLHMQLLPFDYLTDQPTNEGALSSLVGPITKARSDDVATILLDGGDFLQGSPLSGALTDDPTRPHPMIAAFNHLDYDAVALGNHEFEFGLDYLRATLKHSRAIPVCANITTGPGDHFVAPWTILRRHVLCSDGSWRQLRIGVIGFAPPPLTEWNSVQLAPCLRTEDILSSALIEVPKVRRAGAHLVIALCHGGPSPGDVSYRMENAASALAGVSGIDAILMGHLHDTFPGPSFASWPGADSDAGTIFGTPAMMPGSHGTTLGQMDLDLQWTKDADWRVASHAVTLLPAVADPGSEAALGLALPATVKQAHDDTRAGLAAPVSPCPDRLTTYFAAIGHDQTADMLAQVQRRAVENALLKTPFSDLPVLSATTSFRAGGQGGKANYTDVGPGVIRIRDCHALAPFQNNICAVVRRGWQVRQWLARTSAYFAQVIPGQQNQSLLAGNVAHYHFDTIHGLTYDIDLSVPFDAGRIRNLKRDGVELDDDARVIVTTSTYRANGGGGLMDPCEADIVYCSRTGARTLLISALEARDVSPRLTPPIWRFAPIEGASVVFETARAATTCPPDIAQLTDVTPPTGPTARFQLDLSR